MHRVTTPLVALGALLAGCGGTGEPQTSYCEAVCDWAVACHEGERDIDRDASYQACLDATRASDDSCAKAEAGELNPAAAKLLEPCTNAVQAANDAGECSAFTGTIDEIKTATPPTECAGQGTDSVATFEAARNATKESGDALCQRFTDTTCARTDECILGDFSGQIPQEVIDAVGGTPYELCVERLAPVQTTPCQDEELYLAETNLDEVNPPRQAARECLDDFTSISCPDLFAGELTEVCVGSFSDPADLIAVAQVLLELSDEFAEAAQSVP